MLWSRRKGALPLIRALSVDRESEKREDSLREKYERTSSSDLREDSKYEDLFNQEDWLETSKLSMM